VTASKQSNQFSAIRNINLDLNSASAQALQKVYVVEFKLSERILRYRREFEGGFADMVELLGVYGLFDEVIERIKQKFNIKNPRSIQSIDLNKATQEALVKVPFIGTWVGLPNY
jgi:DNA uptake protein ComE-like DNA-binding protein